MLRYTYIYMYIYMYIYIYVYIYIFYNIYIHCILYAKLSCLPSKYIYIQWTFSKIHIMVGQLAWLWPSHADGWLQHVAGSLKEVSWIAVSGQPRPSSCSVTERDPTYVYIYILYIYIYCIYIYTYSVYYIYMYVQTYTHWYVCRVYIYTQHIHLYYMNCTSASVYEESPGWPQIWRAEVIARQDMENVGSPRYLHMIWSIPPLYHLVI
jgi:hypothetical protein